MLNLFLFLVTALSFMAAPLSQTLPVVRQSEHVQPLDIPYPGINTGLVGTHEVTLPNGDPLGPGLTVTVEVTATGPGGYEGKVFIDSGDGPKEQKKKQISILGQFGYYNWLNLEGVLGGITYHGPGEHMTVPYDENGAPVNSKKRLWTRL